MFSVGFIMQQPQFVNAVVPKSIYCKQILTALFWGGMYVAARVIAADVPAFSASFLRFLMAGGLLLFIWLASPNTGLPRGREWIVLIILGLSGAALYNFLFFNGMATVSAGRGAVIITTNPLFTAVFARILFKEKMPFSKALGILVAAFGAVLVITRGHPLTLFSSALSHGDFLLFGAALCWSAYSLCNKLVRDLSATTTITFTCIFGCIMLFPFAVQEGIFFHLVEYSWQAWLALIYVAVCCTVLSFIWFNQGIMHLGAQRASLFINLVPVFTVFMGAIILKESLELSMLAGVIIVCAGVFWANRRV